jgi:hypothetical protein
MTDKEKLQAVELALAGVKVENIRAMAGTFSYVRRTGNPQESAQDFVALLEDEEFQVLNRVQLALGLDTLYRICTEVLEEYDSENPVEYRRDYVSAFCASPTEVARRARRGEKMRARLEVKP